MDDVDIAPAGLPDNCDRKHGGCGAFLQEQLEGRIAALGAQDVAAELR
jgi:hypothetical protein